jgi:AP-1-like factor
LALDPKQKRKAQNRAAQRAFRERKEKHVSELQERIRELEALTSKTDEDLIQENNLLKEQLKKLEEENYALKDAKFTFEFPVSDQQQQQPDSNNNTNASPISPPDSLASPTTTTTPTTTNDMLEDTYGGSSSSSNEQSPRSSNQEDDSDAPATKTPTSLQDPSSFLSFGSITPSQGFDFLAMGSGGSDMFPSSTTTTTTPTPTTSGYDAKDLFHTKGDLFTGYRTSDDFYTDDFLLGNTTGLPALFGGGGDDDLFGFSSTASSANQTTAPFVLDQFYMPDEQPRPHVRKETLQASLQRAKQNGVRAFEVQEQLKNCPDFNLDDLCADLKQKASCCESKYVLTEHDVESYLQCFGQQM